jgi:hypothetical protein
MALSKSGLKTRITTELTAQGFDLGNAPMAEKMAEAIANAVIDEITTNAVVNTVVSGTLPAGPAAATGLGAVT